MQPTFLPCRRRRLPCCPKRVRQGHILASKHHVQWHRQHHTRRFNRGNFPLPIDNACLPSPYLDRGGPCAHRSACPPPPAPTCSRRSPAGRPCPPAQRSNSPPRQPRPRCPDPTACRPAPRPQVHYGGVKSEWTLHQGNEANDSYCRTAYFGTRTQAPTNSSTSADPSTPAADDSSPRSEVSDGAAPAVPPGSPINPSVRAADRPNRLRHPHADGGQPNHVQRAGGHGQQGHADHAVRPPRGAARRVRWCGGRLAGQLPPHPWAPSLRPPASQPVAAPPAPFNGAVHAKCGPASTGHRCRYRPPAIARRSPNCPPRLCHALRRAAHIPSYSGCSCCSVRPQQKKTLAPPALRSPGRQPSIRVHPRPSAFKCAISSIHSFIHSFDSTAAEAKK